MSHTRWVTEARAEPTGIIIMFPFINLYGSFFFLLLFLLLLAHSAIDDDVEKCCLQAAQVEVIVLLALAFVVCVSWSSKESFLLPFKLQGHSSSSLAFFLSLIRLVETTCDQEVFNNVTYFMSPKFPAIMPAPDKDHCSVKIKLVSDDISQIRLDFLHFTLVIQHSFGSSGQRTPMQIDK